MFGSMILQIPVQGGYKGGNLVVENGGVAKKFSYDIGSHQKFFLTVYQLDCEHQLELVTQGWQLNLVFNLVWKHHMPIIRAPSNIAHIAKVLKVVKEIRESLLPWIPSDGHTDLPIITPGIIQMIHYTFLNFYLCLQCI
jgi:hypothetical protein